MTGKKSEMTVLVVGGGGREHAVVSAFRKSARVKKLYCAPGNAGIAALAECVPIGATELDGLTAFAQKSAADLVFVTPDDPLSLGLVDRLNAAGIRAFGPKAAGARLESSKSFAKAFMKKYDIPTAGYEVFDDYEAARAYVERADRRLVIKADGLALGKGVCIPKDRAEALKNLRAVMVDGAFGHSGSRVVIEEFLTGREVTVLAFTDGKTVTPMPSSQDHKRAYDGDLGPNTGGMGAFSPSPYFTKDKEDEFNRTIAQRTLAGLCAEGIDYRGVLYFGLMLTGDGIKVIEYNARLGDPETQAVFPLLKTDLADICDACIDGTLAALPIGFSDQKSLTVVVAGSDYPAKSSRGAHIEIGDIGSDCTLFHAGTAFDENKRLVTNGGRIFALTALGGTMEEARQRVYRNIGEIRFDGARFRKDIGLT
ncbi:MAG: phosphoribosylamine--glycine ligase [Clostridiales bacterium]|jgi:phosphoribosylamine--glycine ligase|nr:phosphoribosylamine--glycine ligase [Clostridiales bacterium]